MLIWIILFLVVVGVSFVLAFRSMGDYREAPRPSVPYSVFLIGNPRALTSNTLQNLSEALFRDKLILSFERLFKGSKRALVVFGPAYILQPFSSELGLSEIEDYSRKITGQVGAWEIGKKSGHTTAGHDVSSYIPDLKDDEEFWWQVVLRPGGNADFTATVRAVFRGRNRERLTEFEEALSGTGKSGGLTILPQSYLSEQVVKFYQDRSLGERLVLPAEEVVSLLGI